jgi:hypothetical protein
MAQLLNPSDTLAAVQACWCELLESTVGGAPAQCCVVVGVPALVDCCAGFAWVRLVNAYPTTNFPRPYNEATKCPLLTWALVVEVGITRCAAQPCDPLGNACCDAEAESSAQIMSDFAAAAKLFLCGCIGLAPDQIVPGQVRPYGPEGGCVGLTAQATLQASLPGVLT